MKLNHPPSTRAMECKPLVAPVQSLGQAQMVKSESPKPVHSDASQQHESPSSSEHLPPVELRTNRTIFIDQPSHRGNRIVSI